MFDWPVELIQIGSGSYLALELGNRIGGGIVERERDAIFATPFAHWCRGRDAVGESWLMPGGPPPRLRYVETRVNAQLALGTYQLDSGAGAYVAIAIDVLALRGGQISEIIAFREPEFFARVGLPDTLPF